jgi:hypothetical protein
MENLDSCDNFKALEPYFKEIVQEGKGDELRDFMLNCHSMDREIWKLYSFIFASFAHPFLFDFFYGKMLSYTGMGGYAILLHSAIESGRIAFFDFLYDKGVIEKHPVFMYSIRSMNTNEELSTVAILIHKALEKKNFDIFKKIMTTERTQVKNYVLRMRLDIITYKICDAENFDSEFSDKAFDLVLDTYLQRDESDKKTIVEILQVCVRHGYSYGIRLIFDRIDLSLEGVTFRDICHSISIFTETGMKVVEQSFVTILESCQSFFEPLSPALSETIDEWIDNFVKNEQFSPLLLIYTRYPEKIHESLLRYRTLKGQDCSVKSEELTKLDDIFLDRDQKVLLIRKLYFQNTQGHPSKYETCTCNDCMSESIISKIK